MSDGFGFLDYGKDVVWRYRASGRTRKEFAAEAGIPVTTLDYYIRRVNRSSAAEQISASRILPVHVVPAEQEMFVSAARGGLLVCLANGLAVEVRRGFDAELLCEVLAVLEAHVSRAGEQG